MDGTLMVNRGVYPAERAAALSGVPLRTMYGWATKRLVTPSVSAERLMLWSWPDLVALRAVYWLRHPHPSTGRRPTAMQHIRTLLGAIGEWSGDLGADLASKRLRLYASHNGVPFIHYQGRLVEGSHEWKQSVAGELVLDLIAPFSADGEFPGPDLLEPRPHVRIVPGKLAGEPHILGTRIETRVLWALREHGFDQDGISRLYPELEREAVDDALSLEAQLNSSSAFAA